MKRGGPVFLYECAVVSAVNSDGSVFPTRCQFLPVAGQCLQVNDLQRSPVIG